jgi:hypothetical protein
VPVVEGAAAAVASKVAGMGMLAKAGLAGAMTLTSVTTAGAAGVLPGPATDVVRGAIENVSPMEFGDGTDGSGQVDSRVSTDGPSDVDGQVDANGTRGSVGAEGETDDSGGSGGVSVEAPGGGRVDVGGEVDVDLPDLPEVPTDLPPGVPSIPTTLPPVPDPDDVPEVPDPPVTLPGAPNVGASGAAGG